MPLSVHMRPEFFTKSNCHNIRFVLYFLLESEVERRKVQCMESELSNHKISPPTQLPDRAPRGPQLHPARVLPGQLRPRLPRQYCGLPRGGRPHGSKVEVSRVAMYIYTEIIRYCDTVWKGIYHTCVYLQNYR